MKRLIMGPLLLLLVFIFPVQVFADDFTIDGFSIDATLQEDGNVQVKEVLTYNFDGSFNGITREIYPKKGSGIQDLQAEENGKPLKIDGNDGAYKIHRKAKDETVVIQLSYTILNGVERYADMGQFYWPFFDDRNETDFGNVSITVHLPEATDDVIAMGYHAARGKETTESDGTAIFELGNVSSGENADIRVGYDESLFSGAPLAGNKSIRSELLEEQQSLAAAQAIYDDRHELTGKVAPYVVGGAVLLLILIGSYALRLQQRRKENALQQYPEAYFVPESIMSLPATVRYTAPQSGGPQIQTTALLDLLRKGYIEKVGEEEFQVVNRNTEYEHERLLIEWLFDGFGDGKTFSYNDLDVLQGDPLAVKEEVDKFRTSQIAWESAVRDEINENHLKGDVKGVRILSIITGLLLIAPMVWFGIYNQPMWLFFLVLPSMALILLGVIFNPKTVKGYGISHQWKAFRKRLPAVSESDFNEQLDDEQKRAVIYGIGTKTLENNTFFKSKQATPAVDGVPGWSYFPVGIMATHYLTHADTAVATSTTSSSSSSMPGGGAGGGGGGAGAF